jgi:putative IMPACT (imprinted ancient) family translation regulator
MYCVKTQSIIEDTIKKSHFIGIITPCHTPNDINHQYQNIQQQHPNANHIAFAYHLKNNGQLLIRCHDAGEPSGTAGKPILNHLEGNQLINVLILVVRYFGGIKLGAGGLSVPTETWLKVPLLTPNSLNLLIMNRYLLPFPTTN